MKPLAVAAAALLLATPVIAQNARSGFGSTNDPARLVALGERLERQGELPGAMVFYERALQIDPAYPMALRAAAANAMQRGDGAEAMRHYSVWANAEPRNSAALVGLASSLIIQQKPAEALALLQRATDLGGARGAIEAQRGIALDLQGDTRAAQQAYAAALDANPTDAVTTQRMALSLALGRDNGAALTLMKRFGAEPESAEVRRTLALIHALGGRQEDAAEIAASLLPFTEAQKMRAFYAQLPRLTPRERALAVHFGMSGKGTTMPVLASNGQARAPRPVSPAPAPPPPAPAPQRAPTQMAVVQPMPVQRGPAASPAEPVATPATSADVVVAPIDLAEVLPAAPARGERLSSGLLRARPRYWVQVSSLADPARLPAEWRRVRGSAGSTIEGQWAYVQRAGGMNRLLIGPFSSEWSARQMVGKLKARRVSSVYTRTPAGADLVPLG